MSDAAAATRRLLVAAVAVGALTACTSSTPVATPSEAAATTTPSAAPAPTPTTKYSPGAATLGDSLFPAQGDGGYDAIHYDLAIAYDPAKKTLTGDEGFAATAKQNLSRFDLDLHGLTVTSITVDGAPATWTRAGDKLQITPSHGIDNGTPFTAHLLYHGVPTDFQDPVLGFEGFTPSGAGAIAQGEPLVASTWYAVNEHPRDKATYDITVTAPSNLSALSNGVLISKVAAGTDTTWRWSEGAPMASYLAMVAIGKYRVVTSTHKGLPVVLAVDAALPKSVDATLARTPEIVDFLATQFGPYPFDAIGGIVHNDSRFNFALENQTRPVYSADFFRDPSSDNSWVIAHELAHEWYGDSVSVNSWKDLWLNEGFATYAEWLWSQHEGGKTPKQTFDAYFNGGSKLPTDPPGNPQIRTLFGNSVYDRGAATLEALRISVGDTAFFSIIRAWAAQRKYGNGDTAQFIALAEQISGKSLTKLFNAWLFTAGMPAYPKFIS